MPIACAPFVYRKPPEVAVVFASTTPRDASTVPSVAYFIFMHECTCAL